ncbi:MAG TPA: single-stranded DNA-binding protein [Gemmata sp.]|jgi:single-strand DNA-binding protein|nr:single-stranded DNA-binding protein [Gemmata sp.]
MATLNKVMLIGRLTANPEEPRTLPNSGSRVIKFRFAVGRSRKNPTTGNWEPDPNLLYIDCEAFHRPDTKRDLVSLIQQYAKQGDQLYIEGRLQLDEWMDKTTNQKRSKHKVVVENIEFLGSRNADGSEGAGGRPMGSAGGRPAAGRPTHSAPSPDDGGGDEFGGGEPSGGDDPIPF